jgi:hypothetical protein
LSVIVTVRSSVCSIVSTGSYIQAIGEAIFSLRTRAIEASRSSTVSGEPSWKVTPSRRV